MISPHFVAALVLSFCACSIGSQGARERSDDDTTADDAGLPFDAGTGGGRDAQVSADGSTRDGAAETLPCNGHVALCARRYNEVAYPSTHNGHAAQAYGYGALNANQASGLDKQLDDGIRGFLMDVYEHNGQHVLCHGPCQLNNTPHADWLNLLKSFLDRAPREVVTIIYQDGLAVEGIVQDLSNAGLTSYVYTHTSGSDFPTLSEMIADNTRLVVTAESGRPPPSWFHHVWDIAWDTPYEFRNAADFNCQLNRGMKGHPLFLVNHWVSSGFGSVYLPSEDGAKEVNKYDVLYGRLQACRAETGQLPNFVAVDFYEHGELFKAVAALNGL